MLAFLRPSCMQIAVASGGTTGCTMYSVQDMCTLHTSWHLNTL